MSGHCRLFAIVAALSLCIATGLGALASHALPGTLEPRALESVRTAIAFQFHHSLGLLGVAAILVRVPPSRWLLASGWLLIAGVIVFAGSIYLSALAGVVSAGRFAPWGGTALMLGWLTLAVGLFGRSLFNRTQASSAPH